MSVVPIRKRRLMDARAAIRPVARARAEKKRDVSQIGDRRLDAPGFAF